MNDMRRRGFPRRRFFPTSVLLALLIGAAVLNKVSGGLVTGLAKDLISTVAGGLVGAMKNFVATEVTIAAGVVNVAGPGGLPNPGNLLPAAPAVLGTGATIAAGAEIPATYATSNADHEHPLVDPQVSHFRQVPLRTSVKLPHSPQESPS